MEPLSTHRWLGVGAALSGLPAAGGCFCAALLLALVADSDAGAVHERAWWLGAAVATGAVCAFAAMLGCATLRRGGLPVPVLLLVLAVAGVPFTLPGGLFLPAVVAAVAACAALAAYGLARPPASPRSVRRLTGGLAAGGFAKWRRGYARTVANSLSELRVRPAVAGATVGLTLRAGDRDACGKTLVRRFAVTWQLARMDAGWRATAVAARAHSGATPAADC